MIEQLQWPYRNTPVYFGKVDECRAELNLHAPFRLLVKHPHRMVRTLLTLAFLVALYASSRALDVTLTIYNASCAEDDGVAIATAVGGVPPYTYDWSDGQTGGMAMGLHSGTYSVTVTDAVDSVFTLDFTVMEYLSFIDPFVQVGTGYLLPCMNTCDGGFRLHLPKVVGGYSFTTTPNMSYQVLPEDEFVGIDMWDAYEFLGACAGETVHLAASHASCALLEIDVPIGQSIPVSITLQEVTGSCNAAQDGTVQAMFQMIGNPLADTWEMKAVDDQGSEVSVGTTTIGTSTQQFMGLHPGEWTILATTRPPDDQSFQPACITSTTVTVPDLGSDCGTLSGTLHYETDADCAQALDEPGLPYQLFRLQPGPHYALTGFSGHYTTALPFGDYTLEQLNADAAQLCPAAVPIDVSLTSGQPTVVQDIADSLTSSFDMAVSLYQGIARPGFDLTYVVDVRNLTVHPGEDLVITLDHDALFTFVDATPPPTNNTPGQLQWDLSQLGPLQWPSFTVHLAVPPDPLLIGTSHTAFATVSSATPEVNMMNNSVTRTLVVHGAYDPNRKEAFTSTGISSELYFLDLDSYIDYQIDYQNTGNDTAFTVVVVDTLPAELDLSTLEILNTSHPMEPTIRSDHVLVFTMHNILLPDSTTDEANSHGHVSFRIKPVSGLIPGGFINNAADILFDYNPPVRTNTSALALSISVGEHENAMSGLSLYPVPVVDELHIAGVGFAIAHCEVLSADGRVLVRAANVKAMDVSSLPAGAYVLRARAENGAVHQQRFVKR
jgi:uncharacterized repeat protein (TIGR01451 family)